MKRAAADDSIEPDAPTDCHGSLGWTWFTCQPGGTIRAKSYMAANPPGSPSETPSRWRDRAGLLAADNNGSVNINRVARWSAKQPGKTSGRGELLLL